MTSSAIDIKSLRQELKTWERVFASKHDGRKASKEDIRADPVIAAKYKEYDALSRPTKKIETTTQIQAKVIQPPHFASIQTTPRKVTTKVDNTLISPCRQVSYPVSPTPQALRVRLGPTPQRNGQVLGLFDNDFQTPSRTRQALNDIHSNVIATPSGADKSCHDDKFDNENDLQRFGRTPTSSGKRYMLDIFATPLKRKREECLGSPIVESKHEDHTPKFLRRTTLDFRSQVGLGNATNTTSSTRQKQPLVRSLSAIIRGLKDQIEEQADEELDLLRELEQAEVTNPKSGGTTLPQPIEKSATHDEREMPLGPDRAAESDGEDEGDDLALAGADGQPRKVWKKKGLKRQTRRVNMRPAPRPVSNQVVKTAQSIGPTEPDEEFARVDSNSDSDTETNKSSMKKQPVKKEPSNSLAHTNFCRLKIKNKNSKAKGRGRFAHRR